MIELPFCAKGSGIDEDWADKLAASDKGSYYMQHLLEENVQGNCVAVIL